MKVKNPLLVFTVAALAAYWSLGWYVPNVIFSVAFSVLSFLMGAAISRVYGEAFFNVLFRRERSGEGDGAHLGVLGVFSIATSFIWGGAFTFFWNILGQPEQWLGTPASNFSRLLLIAGCVCLYFAPSISKQRVSVPSVAWIIIALVTAASAGLAVGIFVGKNDVGGIFRSAHANYSTCPGDRPYWVGSASQTYHGPDSPYRMLIAPRRCFATEEEALAEGYRPIGAAKATASPPAAP